MRKLRIPWLASSKAAANLYDPLNVWLLEQERRVQQVARQRGQDYLCLVLCDVVHAWFFFVFVGNDSEVDSHYAGSDSEVDSHYAYQAA